jgi:DNA-3-methyladenine glycosylase
MPLTRFLEIATQSRSMIDKTEAFQAIKLDPWIYQDANVTRVAKALLGKVLCTRVDGQLTSGVIVETEAYSHKEKGCHAYNNRKTGRNQVMFREGGHAYVYLCYGIHYLFNVVTNTLGVGDAVLVRALEPRDGVVSMMERTGATSPRRITSGPGKLSKAMGIDRKLNGLVLGGPEVWIEEGVKVGRHAIQSSERIGIDYAGKDARLPWRFTIRGNEWTSK